MNGAATKERRDRLRHGAIARRNQLSRAESQSWSRLVQARALELHSYRSARAIALYSPVQNEVDTAAILEHAVGAKKSIFYPRTSADVFEFAQITSASDLIVGRYGILEPGGSSPLSTLDREALVVFVPGVVFDCVGNRLGRGGGGYDRMLGQLDDRCVIVGLAYEFQIVDAVPAQPWDHKVHFIITENRTIDCGIMPHHPMRWVDA
jgi:5-formyltetrahydrofolate cyclo-ligase